MANYKEIVTKAVIGKGKKNFITNHSVKPMGDASTVLGCWVINHTFSGRKIGDSIRIEGRYDVNIWYSSGNDTKTEVANQSNTYVETVKVNRRTEFDGANEEIIVRSLKQPNCVKAEIVDGTISYIIEKELGIEIVGDTKVKIAIDENEEPWDEIYSVDASIEEDIEKQVDEDTFIE